MNLQDPLFSLDPDDTPRRDDSAPAVDARTEREETLGFLGGLEAAGLIMRRKASRGRCPTCRATVLRGLDADLAAMPAIVDPTPLDLRAWEACRVAGRALYVLKSDGDRWILNDLDPYAFPGSKRQDALIVPEHTCRGRFPGRLPDTRRHNPDPDAPPPF